jgi:hypothetical protein
MPPMKKLILFLLLSAIVPSACKKKEEIIEQHPMAGEWKLKSTGSQQYLKYKIDNPSYPGVDIYDGIQTNFKFMPANVSRAYYIVPVANQDKYIDANHKNYTYLTCNNFSNATTQLFTVEPIHPGSDRFYIRSVSDTAQYLVSKYSNNGRATTTTFNVLDLANWDCIWQLEKP